MAKIWLERGLKRQLVSLLLFETPSRLKHTLICVALIEVDQRVTYK